MSANILLVDDDPGAILLMGRILSNEASLRFATDGADAVRLATEQVPDLVLLDAEMPGMSGFEVCAALKAKPELTDVPVVFVTSHRDESFEIEGFNLGAADFIAKPVNPKLLVLRVRAQLRIKRMADELRQHASTDALTGVANRRRLDERLEQEWLRARGSGEPLALVLLDLDHFKQFNDTYGHPAGDRCLRLVARALVEACMRPADLVARYGGEEFAMLLPGTHIAGAEHVARRVVGGVEALQIPHVASPSGPMVTVSAGVACMAGDTTTIWRPGASLAPKVPVFDLLQRADQALYVAKHSGRGRAVVVDIADEAHEGGATVAAMAS